MIFKRKFIKKHNFIDFKEFEMINEEYLNRRCKQIIDTRINGRERFGFNGTFFLYKCINRSYFLFKGFVEAVNSKNSLMCFLATRSHYETTGSIAFFLDKIKKFYSEEITFEEIEQNLFKLSIGYKCYEKKDIPFPEPISVMNFIDKADRLSSEFFGQKFKGFRNNYDFLSEFCHPNLLGTTIGSRIEKGNALTSFFDDCPLEEKDVGFLFHAMSMSCIFCFVIFDRALKSLKENETFPEVIF